MSLKLVQAMSNPGLKEQYRLKPPPESISAILTPLSTPSLNSANFTPQSGRYRLLFLRFPL